VEGGESSVTRSGGRGWRESGEGVDVEGGVERDTGGNGFFGTTGWGLGRAGRVCVKYMWKGAIT